MLVVNERETQRPEQCVLDWMRTWNGQYVIVGLAVSGYPIPDGDPGGTTRQLDVVVITPRAVVVIEVQEITAEVTGGVLSVRADGHWQLSGFDGEPVSRRDSDPFGQVTNDAYLLSQLVRRQHPDALVDRLIVVVPPRDATITLDIESRKPGGTVVLGSSAQLRAWFLRTANRKLIWTAEQAYELLGELGLADAVTIEELVVEGFPSQTRRPEPPASRVLVQAHASSALGAVELSDDTRMSSNMSPTRTPYPPWLPADIEEEVSESVAPSRPEAGTDMDAHAQVSVPPEPQPVDHPEAMQAPPAPQLSSAFTDRWSSWIEPDGLADVPPSHRDLDRRGRPHREPRLRNWLPTPPNFVATAAPQLSKASLQPSAPTGPEPRSAEGPRHWTATGSGSLSDIEPRSLSTAPAQPSAMVDAQPVSEHEPPRSSAVRAQPPMMTEPRPLRSLRPVSAPAAQRTHQASTPRLASAMRACVATVAAKGTRLIAGLPQLLATAVVIGVVVATTWLLISEGVHPKPTVVEPRPESSTEPAVLPQLPAPTESPAAHCFPFQQQC
ncbi:NERD domain-containing protein [Nocardia sp. NPDC052112]|uniref:nuclease-related domain-containing protein n=1 Tax=Nocardia sp. NPDC052112 TaxID=3155646 RepID=UPI00343AD8A6